MSTFKALALYVLISSFLTLGACTNKSSDEQRPPTASELQNKAGDDQFQPVEGEEEENPDNCIGDQANSSDCAQAGQSGQSGSSEQNQAGQSGQSGSGEQNQAGQSGQSGSGEQNQAGQSGQSGSGEQNQAGQSGQSGSGEQNQAGQSGQSGSSEQNQAGQSGQSGSGEQNQAVDRNGELARQDKETLNYFYCAAKDVKHYHQEIRKEAKKNGLAGVCFELATSLELREGVMRYIQQIAAYDAGVSQRLQSIVQKEQDSNGMENNIEDLCFQKQPRRNIRNSADGKTKISDVDEARFLQTLEKNLKSWDVIADAVMLDGKDLYKNIVKEEIKDSDCDLPAPQAAAQPTNEKEKKKSHLVNLYCLAGAINAPLPNKMTTIDVAFSHFTGYKFGACHTLGKSADAREQFNTEFNNLNNVSSDALAQAQKLRTDLEKQGLIFDLDSLCKAKRPLKADASGKQVVLDEDKIVSLMSANQKVYSASFIKGVQNVAKTALEKEHTLKVDDSICGGLSDEQKQKIEEEAKAAQQRGAGGNNSNNNRGAGARSSVRPTAEVQKILLDLKNRFSEIAQRR